MEWLVRGMREELKSWGHVSGDSGRLILKSYGVVYQSAEGCIGQIPWWNHDSQNFSPRRQPCQWMLRTSGPSCGGVKQSRKSQVEQKAKVKLNLENNICQWMVRWAATMCCKYMVGKDEKAPYERKRRKKCNLIVVPFGERVLYKEIREGKDCRTKFETEDKEGIWLGHNRGTNEALIGTPHGVAQAYSFRRRDDASRWSQALIPMHTGECRCHPRRQFRRRFQIQGLRVPCPGSIWSQQRVTRRRCVSR